MSAASGPRHSLARPRLPRLHILGRKENDGAAPCSCSGTRSLPASMLGRVRCRCRRTRLRMVQGCNRCQYSRLHNHNFVRLTDYHLQVAEQDWPSCPAMPVMPGDGSMRCDSGSSAQARASASRKNEPLQEPCATVEWCIKSGVHVHRRCEPTTCDSDFSCNAALACMAAKQCSENALVERARCVMPAQCRHTPPGDM